MFQRLAKREMGLARFENYRFLNLVKLINLLTAKTPSISDIRLIDRNHGTTYYTDLVNARDWPPYIEWFGLSDSISDLVTDYMLDSLAEDEVEDLEVKGRKLSSVAELPFTPTDDPALRTEFGLDKLERGWFGRRKQFRLERELKMFDQSALRIFLISSAARDYLAYALQASRSKRWSLAAFCMAQCVLEEINIKYVLMREHAVKNGLRLNDCEPMQLPSILIELVRIVDPNVDEDELSRFYPWSTGPMSPMFDAHGQNKMLEALFDFISRVQARVWPSPEHIQHISELILTERGEGQILEFLLSHQDVSSSR